MNAKDRDFLKYIICKLNALHYRMTENYMVAEVKIDTDGFPYNGRYTSDDVLGWKSALRRAVVNNQYPQLNIKSVLLISNRMWKILKTNKI